MILHTIISIDRVVRDLAIRHGGYWKRTIQHFVSRPRHKVVAAIFPGSVIYDHYMT